MEKTIVTSQTSTEQDAQHIELNESSQRTVTGVSWVIVVLAVLSSIFLCALDNTVVATVRPSVIDTFGHVDLLPWMSVAYVVANLGVNPTWSKMYTYFDYKILYLIATILFEVGSAFEGAAQNLRMFIAGQIIAGMGGSGVYVGTISILSSMTTPTERAQYLNFVGMSWSLGTVLGPIVGGGFANSPATWRWAFYLNICVAAVAIPICVFLIPRTNRNSSNNMSVRQRLQQLDWLGAVLFLAGVFATVMMFGFGGTVYNWRDGRMIALYVSTAIIWATFGNQQYWKWCPKDPIFPGHFIPEPLMLNLFVWTAIAISNLFITVFTLPILFQYGLGFSPLRAAVFMLPYIGACVMSAGMSSPFIVKYPIYMAWFVGAAVLMLVGSALMTTISIDTSVGMICGYSIIQGVGGAVIQLPFTIAQIKKASQVSEVTAFLTCAQMSGLVFTLGVSTCIFVNLATDKLLVIIPNTPREMVQAAIQGLGNSTFQSLSADTRQMVLAVIVKIAGKVFYMNVASAALGLIAALFMPRERLNFEGSQ